MADLIYVAIIVAFFALAVLLVRVCGFIIGPDELMVSGSDDETDIEELAA